MAKLIKKEILLKAIRVSIMSTEFKNVLNKYQELDSYESEKNILDFAETLKHLNVLSYSKGCGYFITKPLTSKRETLDMALYAYDVFNLIAAESAKDSYTTSIAQ